MLQSSEHVQTSLPALLDPLHCIQGVAAGMAVLGAAAMGDGGPYRPVNITSHAHAHQHQQRRTPAFSIIQESLLVLLAAAGAGAVGGWAIASLQGVLARWKLLQTLGAVWSRLKQQKQTGKESAAAGAVAYVSLPWLLLQGAAGGGAAVGVQVSIGAWTDGCLCACLV